MSEWVEWREAEETSKYGEEGEEDQNGKGKELGGKLEEGVKSHGRGSPWTWGDGDFRDWRILCK